MAIRGKWPDESNQPPNPPTQEEVDREKDRIVGRSSADPTPETEAQRVERITMSNAADRSFIHALLTDPRMIDRFVEASIASMNSNRERDTIETKRARQAYEIDADLPRYRASIEALMVRQTEAMERIAVHLIGGSLMMMTGADVAELTRRLGTAQSRGTESQPGESVADDAPRSLTWEDVVRVNQRMQEGRPLGFAERPAEVAARRGYFAVSVYRRMNVSTSPRLEWSELSEEDRREWVGAAWQIGHQQHPGDFIVDGPFWKLARWIDPSNPIEPAEIFTRHVVEVFRELEPHRFDRSKE